MCVCVCWDEGWGGVGGVCERVHVCVSFDNMLQPFIEFHVQSGAAFICLFSCIGRDKISLCNLQAFAKDNIGLWSVQVFVQLQWQRQYRSIQFTGVWQRQYWSVKVTGVCTAAVAKTISVYGICRSLHR